MIFTSLKLFSALIIVGACFFAGAALADAEAASYRQLSGMLALLAHIRTRITYTHFSLEVIFSDLHFSSFRASMTKRWKNAASSAV